VCISLISFFCSGARATIAPCRPAGSTRPNTVASQQLNPPNPSTTQTRPSRRLTRTSCFSVYLSYPTTHTTQAERRAEKQRQRCLGWTLRPSWRLTQRGLCFLLHLSHIIFLFLGARATIASRCSAVSTRSNTVSRQRLDRNAGNSYLAALGPRRQSALSGIIYIDIDIDR